MNYAIVFRLLGYILMIEGALLLLPAAASLIYGEWMVLAVFLLTAAVSAGIGFALRAIKPRSKVFYMREGFTATALSWIVISVVGAAPFVLTGCIPNPVDALFETVSGFTTTGASILPAVERDGGVIIPNGNFVLQNGDQVTFLATQENAHAFFRQIHMPVRPVRNALIVGGGAIAFYLSQELLDNHVRVRIVERDAARAQELAEQLPGAQVLNEDGSNRDFLLSEGLESAESFVALTNIDEENVLLTLFAKKHSHGKLVTKVNRLEFDDILAGLDLGSVVYPKYMTCDYIVQYVRALQNEAGSNIKTLYRILDDRVEALEFTVHEESRATGVPLSQLHLKKNLLLCCITRGDRILIPRGGDQIQVGDNVIVVTLEHGLHDLRDIVES